MNRALRCLALLIVLALPAHAALTLHIDTTAEEIYFSGSDSGEPFVAAGPEYIVDWSNPVPNGGTDALLFVPASFNATSGFITNAALVMQEGGYFGVAIGLSQDGPNTVNADSSQRYSYTALPEWGQAILLSLAANPTPLAINPGASDYSDLGVEAVPEPSTWALLALGTVALAFRSARRRAA